MESRALRRTLSSPADIRRSVGGDLKVARNKPTSGEKSDFTGVAISNEEDKPHFPTGFGSADNQRDPVIANAGKSGDHSQSSKPSAEYLGDKGTSELEKVERLYLNMPDKEKRILDGSQPFKMEDKPIYEADRYRLESIIRGIKPDQGAKINYGMYELPQGSDSYNSILQETNAGKTMSRILEKGGNDKWKLEKIVLQVDETDRRELQPTSKYEHALSFQIDKYKVIGLFSPNNKIEKEE
jgi:hypothetical protein